MAGMLTGQEPGGPREEREPDPVLALMAELRAQRYTPDAWAGMVATSWRMARETARGHPRLVLSWQRTATGLAVGTGVALVAEALFGGAAARSATVRAVSGAALCLGYSVGDTYVHLGMNHDSVGSPLHDTLGAPTILTLARCSVAGLLWGRLAGGAPASRRSLALALAMAGLTDIADGQLARRTHHATQLGAYLDSMADFSVALVVTLTLAARRALPGWLTATLLARWLAPMACALLSYLWLGRRATIDSTAMGKVAGVAQLAIFSLALLPERAWKRTPSARGWLHALMTPLLAAAPLAQFARVVSASRAKEGLCRGQR